MDIEKIIDELSDYDLVEELLLRGSDADETSCAAAVAAAIEAAGGDEQKALASLDARRSRLVESALSALEPLKVDAVVIFAHDALSEQLESGD